MNFIRPAISTAVTAGAVIIGDEILSGKFDDANSKVLISHLRRRGARLSRLSVVGDDPLEIGHEVRRCSERFDIVVTSGGIGPTHDDRTIEAISRAFRCGVVRHPRLVALLHEHLGEGANEAALKMADVPDGSELLETDRFPILTFRNIFILPGVPAIFRRQMQVVARRLDGSAPIVERVVLGCYESDVAAELAAVHQEHSQVDVGSYLRQEDGRSVVLVTLESPSGPATAAALEDLLTRLPQGVVLRVESEGWIPA